jgi:coenzyme F420-reducing hydrogenase delta subunit
MPAALQALEDEGMEDVLLREVPCTGAVETWEVLRSFRQGAEAVLIVGCLLENCAHHYGSEVAVKRAARLDNILVDLGFPRGRVAMVHLAEHHANRFKKVRSSEGRT